MRERFESAEDYDFTLDVGELIGKCSQERIPGANGVRCDCIFGGEKAEIDFSQKEDHFHLRIERLIPIQGSLRIIYKCQITLDAEGNVLTVCVGDPLEPIELSDSRTEPLIDTVNAALKTIRFKGFDKEDDDEGSW